MGKATKSEDSIRNPTRNVPVVLVPVKTNSLRTRNGPSRSINRTARSWERRHPDGEIDEARGLLLKPFKIRHSKDSGKLRLNDSESRHRRIRNKQASPRTRTRHRNPSRCLSCVLTRSGARPPPGTVRSTLSPESEMLLVRPEAGRENIAWDATHKLRLVPRMPQHANTKTRKPAVPENNNWKTAPHKSHAPSSFEKENCVNDGG